MEHRQTVFFIDRCLGGVRIAQFLKGLGASVEVHDDHFAGDAEDIYWLSQVTNWGWVVWTRDEYKGICSIYNENVI